MMAFIQVIIKITSGKEKAIFNGTTAKSMKEIGWLAKRTVLEFGKATMETAIKVSGSMEGSMDLAPIKTNQAHIKANS
jgi:hypothetical protein